MHYRFLAAAVLMSVVSGCGKSAPAPQGPAPIAPVAQSAPLGEPAAPTSSGDSTLAAELPAEPTPALEPIPADESTSESTLAEYQPPFPDRVHLFVPPKREGKSTANNQEEAVELLGFVNVRNSHKAVLSINGMVYPVAEGGSQFGVEVISIQPPGVVLQRGRQRWQASLEN